MLCAKEENIKRIELTIDKNNIASKSMFSKFAEQMNSKLELIDEYKYEQAFDYVYRILL